MGINSNARNYNFVDESEEEDLDLHEYPVPSATRPRYSSPTGPKVIPPQYSGINYSVRQAGVRPAGRIGTIPQPLPPLPGQNNRAIVTRQQAIPPRGMAMPQRRPTSDAAAIKGFKLGENNAKVAIYIAAGLIGLILLYFVTSNLLHWWQTWQDDMTYGRPRTMQIDQFVGHNEEEGTPSHFIVQNNNRQVTVVEYPGGDVTKTRVIPGPRLFGKDMDLAPVKVRFVDVNGDNNVDMVLTVDNQEIIYINENSNFRPINNEERNRLSKANGGYR